LRRSLYGCATPFLLLVPGARNISAENFAERMKELENIANGFTGIEKSYAISAGREVRVFVKPQQVDDLSAIRLARDIATKIESQHELSGDHQSECHPRNSRH
jgi:ribonuclease Y